MVTATAPNRKYNSLWKCGKLCAALVHEQVERIYSASSAGENFFERKTAHRRQRKTHCIKPTHFSVQNFHAEKYPLFGSSPSLLTLSPRAFQSLPDDQTDVLNSEIQSNTTFNYYLTYLFFYRISERKIFYTFSVETNLNVTLERLRPSLVRGLLFRKLNMIRKSYFRPIHTYSKVILNTWL